MAETRIIGIAPDANSTRNRSGRLRHAGLATILVRTGIPESLAETAWRRRLATAQPRSAAWKLSDCSTASTSALNRARTAAKLDND